MYSQIPADVRTAHPYHMYEEIKAQPEAVARSLELVARDGSGICEVVARARRVFVTGCGTSFHAALAGAWMLRSFSRGEIDARAVQAFELATYWPDLRPDDAVLGLTHSGTTAMTLKALDRANGVGAETVIVTGFPRGPGAGRARQILPTGYDVERSWAHTASYTAALTSMAAIANRLAVPEERLDLAPLPAIVREALQLEEVARRLAAGAVVADRYQKPPRVVAAGGGVNAFTAIEVVLKLLETSYIEASGWELEQVLHGPLAAVTPETLVLLVAPPGRSDNRAVQLVGALRQIGVVPAVLLGEENAERFEGCHRLLLPEVPEILSPIAYIVPLQFLSYFLAVGEGLNPDLIHRDDERYRLAATEYGEK